MKKVISLLLILAAVTLAGCQTSPESETTTAFVPLVQQPAAQQSQTQSRLYSVPWQIRTPLAEGGYSFTDSTIPLFLYSQEELDVARRVLDAYLQQSFLPSGNPMNIQQIYSIAPDFMASAERIGKSAPETDHGHYLDFDVVVLCDPEQQGELRYLVYNVSLFREYSTNPSGWQVQGTSLDPQGGAYADLTADGVSYPEAYRPLSYEELEALGDLGGQVLFATEMLYLENTTWIFIYKEETNEIVRVEIAYSNIGQYATIPVQ